jgi:hypothetical protein
MATVALRGEQAERFRALAQKEGLTLAKLLVRMMEAFEAQVARPTAATAAPTNRGLAAMPRGRAGFQPSARSPPARES